jgi:hypothetical protein
MGLPKEAPAPKESVFVKFVIGGCSCAVVSICKKHRACYACVHARSLS